MKATVTRAGGLFANCERERKGERQRETRNWWRQ